MSDHPPSDDPRFAGLPTEVIENALTAKCSRCGQQVVTAKSVTGTVMFNLVVPALGYRERGFLCGVHGLELKEFLHPEAAGNPEYQAAKAVILQAQGD